MDKPLNRKKVSEVYQISKNYAYQLVRKFIDQAQPEQFISDGKVVIIDQDAFEAYWKESSLNRGTL